MLIGIVLLCLAFVVTIVWGRYLSDYDRAREEWLLALSEDEAESLADTDLFEITRFSERRSRSILHRLKKEGYITFPVWRAAGCTVAITPKGKEWL